MQNTNTEYQRTRQRYLLRHCQFHVLLNSLFKVLCNFPSRYLFAIGLVVVFSLGSGITPNSSCTSKQLYSQTIPTDEAAIRTGLTPSLGSCLPANFRSWQRRQVMPIRDTAPHVQRGSLRAGLFRVHSPLLTESLLVSFPPLTDMLKFSG
jgi:hypothetical protein